MVNVILLREAPSWCFDMVMLKIQQELQKNNTALNFAFKLINIQKGAFTYYVITEGGVGSLKCLRMIMGEGEGFGLMMT